MSESHFERRASNTKRLHLTRAKSAVRITRLLFEIPICAFVTGGSSEIRRKIFRKSTKMEPKSMENRCDYRWKIAKIAPRSAQEAPGVPWGDCFATQCTNFAVKVAPPSCQKFMKNGCRKRDGKRMPKWWKMTPKSIQKWNANLIKCWSQKTFKIDPNLNNNASKHRRCFR